MTIRPARFLAGDLEVMRPAAFVGNVVAAVRNGDRQWALDLFGIWLDYPWGFHGEDGYRAKDLLDDFYFAVMGDAPLADVESDGKEFLEAWQVLLGNFVLFLMRGEFEKGEKDKPLAERLFEIEQDYADAGFPTISLRQIEEIVESASGPDEYVETRRCLMSRHEGRWEGR